VIFDIITLFPEYFKGFTENTIISRAIKKGIVGVNLINCRDFTEDRYKSCDDYTYGGGAGMILQAGPLAGALDSIQARGRKIIYPTPSGRLYTQQRAREYSEEESIVIICGRYEGIDQRIIDLYSPDEISIGDYIISGGEPAACVIMDSIIRLLKGVIKEESLREESFNNSLLEYPQYTRPEVFKGLRVPGVLLSGHHENIRKWRLNKSIEKTIMIRPDLLNQIIDDSEVSSGIKEIVNNIIEEGEENGFNKSNRS